MDYAIDLVVKKEEDEYLVLGTAIHDGTKMPFGGNFGDCFCNVVGYFNSVRGKIKLSWLNLEPYQISALEKVVNMHNKLEDIKELVNKER